ncbi:Methyl-cpg-binding domain-containing protein [Thalictrum thalictroides]|uniref:Methyl-cpg-binding domain-containing protein n=1 Tax=Thalictrum thalictroides TaxID=46969 RepID=A0A7J6VNX6_THATH|nr:Methyl-cpg-binding domain-containing protein [Thalictrum thalictroides]
MESHNRRAPEEGRAMVPSSTPRAQWHKSRSSTSSISMYSVQCGKCFKWRLISTQEEYEEIRKNLRDNPWFCNKKSNVSCEDPADIEYDNTRTWVIDKPNLPKTPDGFKKKLVVRSDFSKCDAYYLMPTGQKVRTLNEVEQFLAANPKYRSVVNISDFNFTSPKIMEDTIPEDIEGRASSSKKIRNMKDL